jgi:hypothetical protein
MKTEIICITDRSGSMALIQNDAIGGFGEFIRQQREVPGECRVTNVIFDNTVETQYEAVPLAKVPLPLVLEPRGSTALLDAIGQTLNKQGERIAKESWAEKVICVIITDGQENSSREFNNARVKEMIEHAQKHEWAFVFLAANQDAFATGFSFGIAPTYTSNFTADAVGTRMAYAAAGASVTSLRMTPEELKQWEDSQKQTTTTNVSGGH